MCICSCLCSFFFNVSQDSICYNLFCKALNVNIITCTHHKLFDQFLLVQLMLQNLDESFDPGA